ncbi:MAG: hypothetical protein AB7K24_12335, partial [Gemmataceae bacterium]
LRSVNCANCAIEYGYVLRRQASGEGTSLLFLDNTGAQRRASDAAQLKLAQELEKGVAFVPCPRCGWCQPDMVGLARRGYHPGVKALAIGLLVLTGAAFIASLVMGSKLVAQVAVVLALTATVMPIVRVVLAALQDPNAADKVSARCEAGSPHALWGAVLDPERARSACPSCETKQDRSLPQCGNCTAPLHADQPTAEQEAGPSDPLSIWWVGMFGLVAAVLGAIALAAVTGIERNKQVAQQQAAFVAPFQDRIAEYFPAKPAQPASGGELKGKLITVNVKGRHFDGLYFQLPPQLRAASPDEVGTIVWLDWGEDVVGEYGVNTGSVGVVITCQATVINKADGQILHERFFAGGQPPDKTDKHNQKHYGSPPTGEIVGWLAALPRAK